jgi:hypothetical protein
MASRAEDTVDLAKTASEPVHVEMLGSDNIGYKAPLGLAQYVKLIHFLPSIITFCCTK